MSFRLYPEERHFWSFADYGAVLAVMQRLQPKTVLEFGPGSSTLALIEGGAEHIDTLEDDLDWIRPAVDLLRPHRHIVELIGYHWTDPLDLLTNDRRYDFGLVDGPRETERRYACIEYCLDRCSAVLVPLEESGEPPYLRPQVIRMAEARARCIELIEGAGPLAGAWALLT